MRRFFIFFLPFLSILAMSVGPLPDVLTQEMLDRGGNTFVVRKNYGLDGKTLTLRPGQTLVFAGGGLDKGEIVGDHSGIRMNQSRPAFGVDLVISGVWDVAEVHDGWFSFDPSPEFVSNRIIGNLLAFSNDETPCHIFFEEDRTYYFELPYKGRADIGEMVTFRMVDGAKKRNYMDILNSDYDYLRIFTIPSNTHLTVKNRIKMLPTKVGAYFVFWEYGKSNITVDGGGTISGDNDWHRYEKAFAGSKYYGEWGQIFCCFRCHDFIFRDITLTDAFGDCILYMGSDRSWEKGEKWASGLTLERVNILRARRNGVSVGARDVVIRNCRFESCGNASVKGTSPRSGIDFEPDGITKYSEIGNQNVLMENCTFKDNYYDVGSFRNNLDAYGKIATTIRNCHFYSPLKIEGTNWMRFENCYIPFLHNSKYKTSRLLYSYHMEFINCEFGELDDVSVNRAKALANKFVNCKFNTAVPANQK